MKIDARNQSDRETVTGAFKDGGPRPGIRLRLPATSANLGPGFDALGLAISLWLTLEARVADALSLTATGRNPEITGSLENNLTLETYRDILRVEGREVPALELTIHNEIPLGMGCGSSAAALCAGVLLANHFGALGWNEDRVLQEAALREGHPDNVAACLRGGLTASKVIAPRGEEGKTVAVTLGTELGWRLLLALPRRSLSTAKARQLLPESYRREDAVVNVQSTALLVAAFALNRPDLLVAGTEDRFHQPYRNEVCPLLPMLLPLAGSVGIYSVTLSGAGPSVLLIASDTTPVAVVLEATAGMAEEILEVRIAGGVSIESFG